MSSLKEEFLKGGYRIMSSWKKEIPERGQGTMGSQKNNSLREAMEWWVPKKGTP
jgi:hypothetical protein